MSELAQLGQLAGTLDASVSPGWKLLLGLAVAMVVAVIGLVPLAREVGERRRARAWERYSAGPRPSTGTQPLTVAEEQALEDIARRLKADRARRAVPRRRRPARKTSDRAGKA